MGVGISNKLENQSNLLGVRSSSVPVLDPQLRLQYRPVGRVFLVGQPVEVIDAVPIVRLRVETGEAVVARLVVVSPVVGSNANLRRILDNNATRHVKIKRAVYRRVQPQLLTREREGRLRAVMDKNRGSYGSDKNRALLQINHVQRARRAVNLDRAPRQVRKHNVVLVNGLGTEAQTFVHFAQKHTRTVTVLAGQFIFRYFRAIHASLGDLEVLQAVGRVAGLVVRLLDRPTILEAELLLRQEFELQIGCLDLQGLEVLLCLSDVVNFEEHLRLREIVLERFDFFVCFVE